MAVVTIKARQSRKGTERLMREVRDEASRILRIGADRVLVVYGEQDASIYYESVPEVPEASPARPAARA